MEKDENITIFSNNSKNYLMKRFIGEGQFSTVYLVVDETCNKQ